MNRIIRFLPLSLAIVFCWSGSLSAEYTLVLKNGRRITVQSYREEGGTIKFYGLGGEIGIARDQIQSILKAGESEGRGMVFPGTKGTPVKPAAASKTSKVEKKVASPSPGAKAKVEGKKEGAAEAEEKVLTPEEKLAEQRAKEEKEYQKRVGEITGRIKALRERYALATGRSTGPDPTVPVTQEQRKARRDDLLSRLKEAQQSQSGARYSPGVDSLQPSRLSGQPPPVYKPSPKVARPSVTPITQAQGYTKNQKELSDLRNQINQLEENRKKLIQEMKQKNFDTGSLFLQ